ncbi:MAG: AI-2E family transporter [Burkholderiales bacterium]
MPAKRGAAAAAPPRSTARERAPAPPVVPAAAVAPKLTAIEIAALVVATLAVIAGARVAEPFLVPVVAGILLAYALRPLVSGLERWHVPRALAAALVILLATGIVSFAAYAIKDDVNAAVAELPGAAHKLRIAISDATGRSPSAMTHVKAAAAELDKAAAEAAGKPASAATPPPDETVASEFQGMVSKQSGKALEVMSELALAVLLAFFLLAAGDTFRRKVAHLAGESLARRRVTVEVLNQIDAQVQNYLLTMLFTNALVGLATWGMLVLFHLPNAGMWGAFTALLHVIPYAGTVVAAAGIGIALFLHSGSLATAALGVAGLAVIATLIGIVLLTWLQGRAARMNAVSVFVGVLFFGWLWGGWGLLLGLPILAVVKSICDRVEALHPVSELLGA